MHEQKEFFEYLLFQKITSTAECLFVLKPQSSLPTKIFFVRKY